MIDLDKLVLYDKSGTRWVFFVNDKAELCYISDEKEQILQSNVSMDFDIVTDEAGAFHLVTQATDGSLVYFTYDFKNWKKYIILNSKSSDNIMRSFKMFILKGMVHCFYILKLSKKSMLIHHIFSPGEPSSTPKVIDYTESFSCAMTSDGKAHIFYIGEGERLQYKMYKNGSYNDTSFPTDDIVKSIHSLCDSENRLHLLYICKMTTFYTLIYYSTERKIISFGEAMPGDICLNLRGQSITIQWRELTRYYQCTSDNGGNSFKKPVPIAEGRTRHAVSVRLRSAYNPTCAFADKCIALSNGNTIDMPFSNVPAVKSYTQKNHKTEKTDYTVIDDRLDERFKMIEGRIEESKKELERLSKIISSLTQKLEEISPKNDVPQKPLQLSGKVETNEENIKLFESLNTEFENPKIF